MASQIRLTMRVQLEGYQPTIWRRFELEGTRNFLYLHRVLQVLMSWDNYHLHEFTIGARTIGIADPEAPPDQEDERKVRISDVLAKAGDCATYLYDFGDEWTNHIVVEKVEPYEGEERKPICLAGEYASPPEDCGGVWGYQQLLKNLKRKKPREDQMPNTFDPRFFDPNRFDLVVANVELNSIARLPRKKS